jgi:hypothetical protein
VGIPLPVVRKSEFAVLCNVSQGRVSQWLTEGKIDGAAIIGTGRAALIDSDLAMAQVKSRRAVDESCGINGLSTKLDAPTESNHPALQVREGELLGTVAAQLQAEKLKQQKFLTSRLDLEDRARHGVYMDTQGAGSAMIRVADGMLKVFEGSFPEISSAFAAKFKISQREASVLLHEEFHRIRAQLSAVHVAERAKTIQTVEVD